MALGWTKSTKTESINNWNCSCCFNIPTGSIQGFVAIINPSFENGISSYFFHSVLSTYSGGMYQFWTLSGYSGEFIFLNFSQNQNGITGTGEVLLAVPRQQDATGLSSWFDNSYILGSYQNYNRTGYLKLKITQENSSNLIELFSSADNGATWTKRTYVKLGDYLTSQFSTLLYNDSEQTPIEVRFHLVLPNSPLTMPYYTYNPHILDTSYFIFSDASGCFDGSYDLPAATPKSHAITMNCQTKPYTELVTYLLKKDWETYSYFLIYPKIEVYYSPPPNTIHTSYPYYFVPDFREQIYQSWDGTAFFYNAKMLGYYYANPSGNSPDFFPTFGGEINITL